MRPPTHAFLWTLISIILSSCMTMPTMPTLTPEQIEQNRKNFQANSCNYDGAYEWGANEANNGAAMNGQRLAAYCPQETHTAVMQGYRAGYTSIANRPVNTPAVVVVNQNYPRPTQCLKAYGQEACGYSCKAAGGVVACTQNPNHECIIYNNQIHCGLNCQGNGLGVQCEEIE